MHRLQFTAEMISFTYTKLNLSFTNSIATITLDSPKDLNCLSTTMLSELCRAIREVDAKDDINVIIIASSHPKIFCAGADIKQFLKHSPEYYYRREIFNQIDDTFRTTAKPIIAAVNGKALGGGFQLALLADIIVASENAYFALPEITLGLMPGIGGTQRFTKIVGEKRAMQFILSGEGFDAATAQKLGVIYHAYKTDNFPSKLQSIAQKISSKALTALIAAKKAVRMASQAGLRQGLDFEKGTFYPLIATKGAREGITAFVSKRKANFKGL